jgi:hypothetical protein
VSRTPVRDRETVASRLLSSSVEHSYDPLVDIDWAMPEVPGLPFTPWAQSSLHGTAMWDAMSPQQRRELTRHEIASVMGVGLWFEGILMQMLLRDLYDQDPQTRHAQYGLVEIADECRHSIMFARGQEALGTPSYRPGRLVHNLSRLFKTISTKDVAYASTIVAEELLDMLQRDLEKDPDVQPLVRRICRIHVTEEARHVRYARGEVARIWPRLGRVQRSFARLLVAVVAYVISSSLIRPEVYANVGLDPRLARRAAKANPQWRRTRVQAARKVTAFLAEQGAIAGRGPTRAIWRRGALLP